MIDPNALILLIVLLAGIGLIAVYTVRVGVPPMPSSPVAREAIFKLLPDRVDGTVYDLGSGWGGLAIALADRYPDNRVVGVELSPLPYLASRLRLLLRPRRNLHFKRADFLQMPLGDAGLVVCYLMIGAMRRLEPKILNELRPGIRVISHAFAFVTWPPEDHLVIPVMGQTFIYRYSTPGWKERARP